MKQKRVEQSFKAKAFDELFDDLFGLVRVAANAVCTVIITDILVLVIIAPKRRVSTLQRHVWNA